MICRLKKTQLIVNSILNKLIPDYLLQRTDTEIFSIQQFVKFSSRKTKKFEKILDAGAGTCPHKKYFLHADYESTDICKHFDKKSKKVHSFVCNLEKIPKQNNFYDAILCTQVLEHVKNPQKVINEFYRILKPKGKLFLTAPQGEGIHGAPYHFFNFTKYGLNSLFLNAGFKINFVKPRGGIFWCLGKRIKHFPTYILKQYLSERKSEKSIFKLNYCFFLLFPLYVVITPICYFAIPLIFFYLDKLDKRKEYTLGYACYCVKQ